VVAYEAAQRMTQPLPLLLTLGSPLGLQTIVYQRLRPQPPGFPPKVRRWVNIADRNDFIAAEPDLKGFGRPVTLDPEQRDGIRQVFRYRFSVITGGPGVGKTLACALVDLIACMIYPLEADRLPAVGTALAGTAADNLRQTTVCVWRDRVVALPAGTIHKLLHMEPTDDDVYEPNSSIDCGVLIIDETSMISSSLLNVILKNSNAKHVVFVGDGDQLPPIGAGKPFRDMIASGKVPVTRLIKNHRTECAGIKGVCDDILIGSLSSEGVKRHEGEGGFAFHYSDKPAKAFVAAELYADFADSRDLYDIAILTPFNQGEGGTRVINIEVRKALGRSEYVAKGDLILVTKNNYKAVRPDEPNPDNPEFVTIYNGERCKVIKSDVISSMLSSQRMRGAISAVSGL
jgi:ATP-dependent exoDNAse (exonuclease V) alpha subunit